MRALLIGTSRAVCGALVFPSTLSRLVIKVASRVTLSSSRGMNETTGTIRGSDGRSRTSMVSLPVSLSPDLMRCGSFRLDVFKKVPLRLWQSLIHHPCSFPSKER